MISIFNLKTIRKLLGKSTLDQLFISSKDIPKDVFFSTYDKNIFKSNIISNEEILFEDYKVKYTLYREPNKKLRKILSIDDLESRLKKREEKNKELKDLSAEVERKRKEANQELMLERAIAERDEKIQLLDTMYLL